MDRFKNKLDTVSTWGILFVPDVENLRQKKHNISMVQH